MQIALDILFLAIILFLVRRLGRHEYTIKCLLDVTVHLEDFMIRNFEDGKFLAADRKIREKQGKPL